MEIKFSSLSVVWQFVHSIAVDISRLLLKIRICSLIAIGRHCTQPVENITVRSKHDGLPRLKKIHERYFVIDRLVQRRHEACVDEYFKKTGQNVQQDS